MCKGSCRRTPTEGLAECLRWHTVLPHRTTERRLVADPATITTPGIRYQQYGCVPSIPPAWPCHAVPPLHKGGCGEPPLAKLSLPRRTQPALLHTTLMAVLWHSAPIGPRLGREKGRGSPVAGRPYLLCPGGHNRQRQQPNKTRQQKKLSCTAGELFHCIKPKHRSDPPSIAQRGSAIWVQRHAACRARQRSMGPASRWLAAHQISGLASAGRALG